MSTSQILKVVHPISNGRLSTPPAPVFDLPANSSTAALRAVSVSETWNGSAEFNRAR
jgi:hypothetical protein